MNLAQLMEREFQQHETRTLDQLAEATGFLRASHHKPMRDLRKRGVCHVEKFILVGHGYETIYRRGQGVEPRNPYANKKEPEQKIYTPDPIPRPVLGPWGCVWNTPTNTEERV